jgi:hypothetical protein
LLKHKQWILRAYERPHTNPISEVFIQKLWEYRKQADLQYSKNLSTTKGDFYAGIREIFNQPLQTRTGKFPWEDKKLPELPKECKSSITPSTVYIDEFENSYSTGLNLYEQPTRSYTPVVDYGENFYEKDRSRSCSRSRSKSRSKSRSRSRSRLHSKFRSGSRSRLYLKSRLRSKSRSRSRSGSRSRLQKQKSSKRTKTPRPMYRYVNLVTRSGKVHNEQIPQNNPQVIIHQRSRSPSIGSRGRTRSVTSREYSRTPSSFRTPSRSPQRGLNDPISLPPSRQTSRIPTQSSVSSRTQSSRGPGLVPLHIANAGVVINGEINGFRLQVIFSMIHKHDWMTVSTANACNIMRSRTLQQEQYLERTYMDHRYNQTTNNTVNIRLGQDSQGRDIFITTDDNLSIVRDDNFYYRSQSMQHVANRRFILIGMDSIQSNQIQITVKNDKSVILIPNPNYVAPLESKFYKFRALQYPDLTIPTNLDFNIQQLELDRKQKRD